MSRPLRIQYPGAVYHIMNRGRARQPTFVDAIDHRAFLETLAEALRLTGLVRQDINDHRAIGHWHIGTAGGDACVIFLDV
jgi:hypothetical protein